MSEHNMDRYVKDGFEYKSMINRLVIDQTSATTYDLTLKPKFILLGIFSPSFSHVEIEAKDGVPVASVTHYNYVLYTIAAVMLVAVLLIGLSVCDDYIFEWIVTVVVIVLLKVHGYKELKKINTKILSGEPIQ